MGSACGSSKLAAEGLFAPERKRALPGAPARIGIITQQAQSNAAAQQSVNQDATTTRSNLTGVNLDDEAAKMLQYQQAYQAMAQIIQTSGQMFTSLLTAITDG